jgi:hypothetical protein
MRRDPGPRHCVIPAKAGIPVFPDASQTEVPAFAGMTRWEFDGAGAAL